MKSIIEVKGVSKSFIIPHEREYSLKNTILKFHKKKSYETFHALKDITFEIKEGEFIGVIGRNGSGKSTLLKILAGIYSPDKGTVRISDKLSPFLELGIGFNGELSGKENIFLYSAVLGLSKEETLKKYDSIVEFSGLDKFIDSKLKNYSSGMQVRLAFSVAIMAEAPIMIIDEVFAVGDYDFQQKCLNIFKRFKEEKKTIILVSHDMSIIEQWCDRCILLENGLIATYSDAKSVILQYNKEVMHAPGTPQKKEDAKEVKTDEHEGFEGEEDQYVEKSFSQEGEDMILRRIFEYQPNGFYIDVGACHPIRFSNTYYFYKKGWKGICIEARPGSKKLFDSLRPRDINVEKAVSYKQEKKTYFEFNESALNTFDKSLSQKRDGKNNYVITAKKEIETEPLTKILDKYMPESQKIDFMSIDVEGMEDEVLQSNDWKRYRPKVLLVEFLEGDFDRISENISYRFLKKQGYKLHSKTKNTYILVSED